ncbi:ceramidase domain-containing protein [Aureimonas leprariae]|uniref:ceramidase domain-containing protein n=1 Tax=Plantimonas leprariae TaxID=2615207 RepID=UPI001FEC4454|nr:ceramidase domain-containing protein [Aureimonas leprariae]
MNWTDPIDGYCERTSAAFWAEPVNAATNLAFILAAGLAFAAWRAERRAGRPLDLAALLLTLLVSVIGVGSFLFHTLANRWSALADTVPIAVFIYGYFALALHRFGGLPASVALGGTLAFLSASIGLAEPLFAPLVGSSAGYVPALLALFGIGAWLALAGRPAGRALLAAGLVFLVSLSFRTLDMPVCPSLPLGTHFLWHVLNALTLLILVLAAIRHRTQRSRKRIGP